MIIVTDCLQQNHINKNVYPLSTQRNLTEIVFHVNVTYTVIYTCNLYIN